MYRTHSGLVDRLSAPRSADPLLLPQTRNAHCQTRHFRDAAMKRRQPFRVPFGPDNFLVEMHLHPSPQGGGMKTYPRPPNPSYSALTSFTEGRFHEAS